MIPQTNAELISIRIDGADYRFEIPPGAPRESVFVFGLHKAGSVLLNGIVEQMAQASGVPVLDISEQSFVQGIQTGRLPAETFGPIYRRDGYLFVGMRQVDIIPGEALLGRRKVLLVRDPRDTFVSYYFSLRQSHWIPPSGPWREEMLAKRSKALGMEIDEFVLSDMCRFIETNLRGYVLAIDESWRVYRYEDIIFDKPLWVRSLAEYLRLELSGEKLEAIAAHHDIIPDIERPDQHVRQVRPGNHRRHLRQDTIQSLNNSLSDLLARFCYNTS